MPGPSDSLWEKRGQVCQHALGAAGQRIYVALQAVGPVSESGNVDHRGRGTEGRTCQATVADPETLCRTGLPEGGSGDLP